MSAPGSPTAALPVACLDATTPAGAPSSPGDAPAGRLLDAVEVPVGSAVVALTSGRRYEIATEVDRDQLVIRSRAGDVVLRIEVTDAGPVLSFSGAIVELTASRRLHLSAAEIALTAVRDASIEVGGDLRERIGGDHHLRIAGEERVEAAKVELQANREGVAVRAMRAIALDGEHIGLNDAPLPEPFPWTSIARGPNDEDDDGDVHDQDGRVGLK